jgi:Protein of unknown function (DUF1236)
MRRSALVGAALLVSVGPAAAQAVIDLTPDQERTVYTTITRERVRTAPPATVDVNVGAVLPSEVEIYDVPAAVEVAPVRRYRYTVVNDRVVLVDPASRKVVRVINR